MSPVTTVELFHANGSVNVEDTTYFAMPFILSANSPSRSGHAAEKPS